MKLPAGKSIVSLVLLWVTFSLTTFAQTRQVDKNNQYWIGYMTNTMLSDRYSWWNDFHLVPEGFGVARTGITRHFTNVNVTGGYAFLWLPPGSGNTRLERHEHRPWGQIQFNLPVARNYSLVQRIRYDARFREKILNGEVMDGYNFNHRIRFLTSFKRTLGHNEQRQYVPYVVISDEVLFNFGKEITTNTFDQNRLSISLGMQSKTIQYQVGFMNRFVQVAPSKFTLNHTLVLWITHRFDLRKVLHKPAPIENTSE